MGGIGVDGAERPPDLCVGECEEPANARRTFAVKIEAQHLHQHDLGKVLGNQPAARLLRAHLSCELVERPAQHGRLDRGALDMDHRGEGREKDRGMIAAERESAADEQELPLDVRRCPRVAIAVDHAGVHSRKGEVTGESKGATPSEQKAIALLKEVRSFVSFDFNPARAAHDRVELDAVRRAEGHAPVAANVEAGGNRALRLEQREDVRERIQAGRVPDDCDGKPDTRTWIVRVQTVTFGAAAIARTPEATVTELQHSIGSGFGARTTATDALDGRDLTGQVAIVTGGYSGLGLETTRALSGAGASVVVTARRPEIARAALAGVRGVEIEALDLADLASVATFADRFLKSRRHADIVIASAGVMACPETRVGPGWEAQFAINHLGHFALINRLWPALAGGARVVVVSSGAHRMGMRWDDIDFARGYDRWRAYGQSKAANVLFSVHLDHLGQEHGVRAYSLHPGSILTPLQRHLSRQEMMEAGWVDAEGNLADPTFKTPEEGAATQVWAATSPQLHGVGGVYCEDCDVAPIAVGDGPGVTPDAINPAAAARLWALCVERTGVDAFRKSG